MAYNFCQYTSICRCGRKWILNPVCILCSWWESSKMEIRRVEEEKQSKEQTGWVEVWRGVKGRARGQSSHQMRKMTGRIPMSCQMAQDQNLQRGVTNTNICSYAAQKLTRMKTSIQKHTRAQAQTKATFPLCLTTKPPIYLLQYLQSSIVAHSLVLFINLTVTFPSPTITNLQCLA